MEFHKRIRKLRQDRGLSQKEAAEKIGLGTSAMCMYENGKRSPSYEIMEKFADFYNVDMNYLLGSQECENSYYLNNDVSEYAEFLRTNPEHLLLFDAVKSVKKEDIELVVQLIKKMGGE